MSKEISDRIREAREAKGWNQSELARALKITPQAVQAWERGGGVYGKRAGQVARALGVTEAWLLLGDDAPTERDPPLTRSALDPSILADAFTGLKWRFHLAGLEYDLARDPQLFVLAYAWAAEESADNLEALKVAVDAAIAGKKTKKNATTDATGKTESRASANTKGGK